MNASKRQGIEAWSVRRPPLAASHGSSRHRAMTLIEVLLAVFILGVGIVSIATLFPAGIVQQRRAIDDVNGPIVADAALGVLRTKLTPEDFGTLQPFGTVLVHYATNVSGDWNWIRPAVFVEDVGDTPWDDRGAIDIFAGYPSTSSLALDIPGSGPPLAAPWSAHRYGSTAPQIVFRQEERAYPMLRSGATLDERPQYYWDCMFRRFEGRVQVAIFVYRVQIPASERYRYHVPVDPSVPDQVMLPYLRQLADVTDAPPWPTAWDSFGPDPMEQSDDALVPTGNTGGFNGSIPSTSWQETGQWLMDQNGNVHRVLRGRQEGDSNRPDIERENIELVRPIPPVVPLPVYFADPAPAGAPDTVGFENIVTHIWYIPRELPVDADGDGNVDFNVRLTPVYVTVREL